MSETKGSVLVAFANLNPQAIKVEQVEKWEPKNVRRIGDTTFFSTGEVYASMKTKDYNEIFGRKYG